MAPETCGSSPAVLPAATVFRDSLFPSSLPRAVRRPFRSRRNRMLRPWWHKLFSRGSRTSSPRRGRNPTRNKTRLLLEALEDRLAPAINVAVVGTGGAGDDSGFAAIRD